MWIIRLIIFLRMAWCSTKVISGTHQINMPYDDSYSSVFINEDANVVFFGNENICIHKEIDNLGAITFTTKTGTNIESENILSSFNNKGIARFHANHGKAMKMKIYHAIFENSGTILFQSETTTRDIASSTIHGTLGWTNTGTIIINNKSQSPGKFRMGLIVKNSGIIILNNQNYIQSEGQINGGGCIYLEEKSSCELHSVHSSKDQVFVMGEYTSVWIKGILVNNYMFMNFGAQNEIKFDDNLNRNNFQYFDKSGRLQLSLIPYRSIIIGSGYNVKSFQVSQNGKVLSYNGPRPNTTGCDCKKFPFIGQTIPPNGCEDGGSSQFPDINAINQVDIGIIDTDDSDENNVTKVEIPDLIEAGDNSDKVEVPGTDGGGSSDENELELPSVVGGGNDNNKNEVEVSGGTVKGGSENNEVPGPGGSNENEVELVGTIEGSSGNGNKEEENPGGIDEGGNIEEEVPVDYNEVEFPGIAEGGGNSGSNEMELPSIIEGGEGSNKNEVEVPGNDVENGGGNEKNEVESTAGITEGGADKEKEVPDIAEGGNGNKEVENPGGIDEGGNIEEEVPGDYSEVELPGIAEGGGNSDSNEMELPSIIEGGADKEKEVPDIAEGGSNDKEVETPGSNSEGSSNEINNVNDSKDQVDGSGSNEIKDGITEKNGSDRDDGSKSGPQPDGSGSNGTEEGENVSNGDNSGDSSNNDPSSEFNGIPPESNSGSTHVPDGAKGSTSEGNYGGDVLGNGSIDDSDEKKLAETNNGSDGIRETSNETNDKDSNSESKNETPPESNGSIPGSTPGSNSGVSDGMNESNGVNTDGFTDGTPSGPKEWDSRFSCQPA
ncbi:uncharacterized protein SPAPADRAFT_69054 [Spathaspora passalidarum NRRL Y-27907]|uniref:Hyphally-regulated cell wall protein N-terminal domain-containing protein n=1 Tax=Spathaspora passalidarum (strain NRRL Y-27907 / 11-Y1) TaxID=619300 RepID=G3AVY0_SPAPN|nr:uncharacterized protein SPAPADRAFT_69054 [Spathaspora passalidarum NRRL Y-27907]EGW30241.1 hypothetical protein SPAPADRAFT_69054 [Spathaspora passalidarum NRRL Y-27907]